MRPETINCIEENIGSKLMELDLREEMTLTQRQGK